MSNRQEGKALGADQKMDLFTRLQIHRTRASRKPPVNFVVEAAADDLGMWSWHR